MLRFITTIVWPAVVTLGDLEEVGQHACAAAERHHAERREALMRDGTISRNARGGQTRWAGVLELDLLHPQATCSEMKAELLAQWGIDVATLRPHQRVLVLHEHAIADCRGHRSPEALARGLREMWPGPRRVHVAKLWETGTVAHNLERLAGYATKRIHRYSTAWGGKRTSYHCDYEAGWRNFIEGIYGALCNHRLLTSNITTQAVAVLGQDEAHTSADRMYHPRATPEGETAKAATPQLSISDNTPEQLKHLTQTNLCTETDTTMRAYEIINGYVDPETIKTDDFLQTALARESPGLTPAERGIMYGIDTDAETLRIEQQRLDLAKTLAEIDKLRATADRERAAAAAAAAAERPTASNEAPPTQPRSSGGNGGSPGSQAPRRVAEHGRSRSTTCKVRSNQSAGSDIAFVPAHASVAPPARRA
ncbi:hypothetical protein [Methylobacterium sp. B4]|uniref:hypothetical protein n=1 Tax=Methylobacterium sp. B4 TaxID=1938755 RepID=UPI0011B81CB7|nr:hypothetical protein [Methylobacterium sp. B4]